MPRQPHHRLMCSGFHIASHTRCRGASNSHVILISVRRRCDREGVVICAAYGHVSSLVSVRADTLRVDRSAVQMERSARPNRLRPSEGPPRRHAVAAAPPALGDESPACSRTQVLELRACSSRNGWASSVTEHSRSRQPCDDRPPSRVGERWNVLPNWSIAMCIEPFS